MPRLIATETRAYSNIRPGCARCERGVEREDEERGGKMRPGLRPPERAVAGHRRQERGVGNEPVEAEGYTTTRPQEAVKARPA